MSIFKSTKEIGRFGEDAAVKHLKKKGYKIAARNYSCKFGEVDIIACQGDTLIFVEVKTRRSALYGTPAEAVTYNKRQHIVNTAKYYLMQTEYDGNVRFDVIEVYLTATGKAENVVHIENAITNIS